MPAPLPGTPVRIALRYPEDEGFARRAIDGLTGRVADDATLPNDPRVLVTLDGSLVRALVDPRELVPLSEGASS